MNTKYDVEIIINNITNRGSIEIRNDSFILEVNGQTREIMYYSIVKLLLNENDFIIIQLNDNNIIYLKTQNYLECFGLLKQNKFNTNSSTNGISNLNVNKVIIHGHTEKELLKDLPIRIYENDMLLVELERLNTFEYEVKNDTTLTFKYGHYKPSYYEVKSNQSVELYLSLDMNWGKINITPKNNSYNVNNNTSQSNSMINNYTNKEYQQIQLDNTNSKKKIRHPIIATCIIIYLVFMVYWIFGPVTEDKVCTRIQSAIKENMKDPSSLDFRSCKVYKKTNNEWYLSGSVAGKNGYGGTSVQTFEAKAIIDGNSFKLDYLNVNAP